MSTWWIISLLLVERVLELWWARRNRLRLLERGGQEFNSETYQFIVIMHLLFLLSLSIESMPWYISINAKAITFLALFFLLQGLRYWCILSLGEYWNTRIIVVPGEKIVRRGPYRYMRHPNYLVVALEFAVIPLLMQTPITFVIFFPLNLFVLYRRVAEEEKVLKRYTDYQEKFC